jgi:hypothetical protein
MKDRIFFISYFKKEQNRICNAERDGRKQMPFGQDVKRSGRGLFYAAVSNLFRETKETKQNLSC